MIDTTTKTAITVSSILTGTILIITSINILITDKPVFNGLFVELICLGAMNLFVGIWFFIYWIFLEEKEKKKKRAQAILDKLNKGETENDK